MIDIFLLVLVVILIVVLIITNIYLLAYYCHPDDNDFGAGFFCKLVVVVGMALSWAQVLLLPLDVSNARGQTGGGIRMDLLWQCVYIALAVMVVLVIPACSYYYETDPEWSTWEKIKFSFCYLFTSIIITIVLLIVSYSFLSTAEIPIQTINCTILNLESSNNPILITMDNCLSLPQNLQVEVSLPIFTIGVLSFVSWILFAIFGGIGLFSLPLDFIYDFCSRNKKMTKAEIEKMKNDLSSELVLMKQLASNVKELEEMGATKGTIFSKQKREYDDKFKKLKAGVVVVDRKYELIKMHTELDEESVVFHYIGLIVGIVCLIVSLTWFVHILVFVIIKQDGKPLHGLLNNLLVYLTENNIAFVATGIFAILCLYLLWATIKGNLKFGMRILLFTSIHPMKKNETYMNSFLFNIMLILLASVSVTQFCAGAFQEYATMTEIDLIFSTQIRYLKFFNYFYRNNIFEYVFTGVAVLSFMYLILRPVDNNSVYNINNKSQKKEKNNKKGKVSLTQLEDSKNSKLI